MCNYASNVFALAHQCIPWLESFCTEWQKLLKKMKGEKCVKYVVDLLTSIGLLLERIAVAIAASKDHITVLNGQYHIVPALLYLTYTFSLLCPLIIFNCF